MKTEYYDRLTAYAREINQDRESLISIRNKMANELQLVQNKLQQLDAQLEDIYEEQEKYWPEAIKETVLDEEVIPVSNNVLKEFYGNPNATYVELALMTKQTVHQVSRVMSNHFKSKLDHIQPSA